MSQSDELKALRDEIDAIDLQIQSLLNDRASIAQRVADTKLTEARESGREDPIFYRPEREAQVLRRVKERNEGPLDGDKIAHIFREIMSACLALEKPLEVAYLGPQGTFSEAAAIKHFGHSALARPQANITDIFSAVERNLCQYGVLPVENSTEGMVTHTLDNFIDSPLKICGELELPIELHVLARDGVQRAGIKKICAHQQALAQSRNWLSRHFPNVELESVSSNGKAAQMAQQDGSIACVAGDFAAERYGLMRVATNIQDFAQNTTRFLVVAREEIPASGNDKTAMIVSVRNEAGALYKLLQPLEQAGISLTGIDTRPSRTENWAYIFFIEFEGHYQDERVAAAIETIRSKAYLVKVLGSYPAAVI